jgi:hypothetical protein
VLGVSGNLQGKVEGIATNHHPQRLGKNDDMKIARANTDVLLIDESRKQVRLHCGEWQ